jgi:hypothetical protein
MALGKPSKVNWTNILDTPFINLAGRYVSCLDKFAQPRRRYGINLVVVSACGHLHSRRCFRIIFRIFLMARLGFSAGTRKAVIPTPSLITTRTRPSA